MVNGITKEFVRITYTALDIAGVATIVAGLVFALVRAAESFREKDATQAYHTVRRTFGRSVLLGLELLVAADIVRTIAVQPTLGNLAVLALLVLIRTFLSWALEVEIEGRWPWQREAQTRG